jgi:amidase
MPGKITVTDLSVVGPLARSADDLDIALAATAGPDEIDATGWRLSLPAPRKKTLREYRVAVMFDAPESAVDVEVKKPSPGPRRLRRQAAGQGQ